MSFSRREALIGILGTGAAGALGSWQLWPPAKELKATPPPSPFAPKARDALAAAAERVLPGAIEAGVPEYLDYWMVREPWVGFLKAGFDNGARWLDRSAKEMGAPSFPALEAEKQDEILGRFQRGELPAKNFSGRGFFEYLLQFTLEGFLSDPVYGGNRDEAGWKVIGHAACHWAPKVEGGS